MPLKNLLKPLAPILAGFIGSPLNGAAVQAISQVLFNKPQAKLHDINNALKNIDAQQLTALKQLEADIQTKLLTFSLAEQQLDSQDRSQARQRELIQRDKTPAILAILMTLGFFAVLGTLILVPIQQEAKSAMDFMVGSLGTAWISSIGYYFGVNYSQRKNGNGHHNGNGHKPR